MTPEQREYVAAHIRVTIEHDETYCEDSDLPAFRAALATLTPEAEIHRELGALASRCLQATIISRDRGEVGMRADFVAYGPACAAFLAALHGNMHPDDRAEMMEQAEADRREGARLRQIRETLSASTAEHSPVTLAQLEAAAMGAEADRRLGKAVREIGDAAEFDRLADRCRDRDDDEEGEDAFRAIATALREESER